MVLELLPYKWEWANLSMLYYNMTQSIGDIHHFAWRPTHYKYAKFKVRSRAMHAPIQTPPSVHPKSVLSGLRPRCVSTFA